MTYQFFNRYEILERLGEGGQSHVFLVRDSLNQGVLRAAKILKPKFFAKKSGAELIQEFQILESLDHENLLRVFDCRFLEKDKAPVMTTEFMEGAVELEALFQNKLTLTFEEKVQVAVQILAGIHYLHQKKIIHGDVKPSNILLKKFSAKERMAPLVKIIDFDFSADSMSGKTDKRAGTPYYMAPEAFRHGISASSDLYSLGVILYRLFVDPILPYHLYSAKEIFAAHMAAVPMFREEHFSKKNVPGSLLKFIQQSLLPFPKRRPSNLAEVLKQFRFEFQDILSELPSDLSLSRSDVRIRKDYRFQALLPAVQEIVQFQNYSSKPCVLFTVAPSGFGKTRFLQEVAKLCQTKSVHFLKIACRHENFWDSFIRTLLRAYPTALPTKKMQSRLFDALKSKDLDRKQQLLKFYLQNLSQDLGGLVFLIDGLSPHLPLHFYETLKTLVTEKGSSKFAFIFTIEPAWEGQAPVLVQGKTFRFTQLFQDLNTVVLEKTRKVSPNVLVQNPSDDLVPQEIRGFCQEGLAKSLFIPPWDPQGLKTYLQGVFPGKVFEDRALEKLLQSTHGNPGIIQILCGKLLEKVGEKVEPMKSVKIADLLLTLHRQNKGYDLQVFKLKDFGAVEKSFLSFIAALGSCSQKHLEEIGCAMFGKKGRSLAQAFMVRAFNEGLIHMLEETSGHYTLVHDHARDVLQRFARTPKSLICRNLQKILKKEGCVTAYQRVHLHRFLGVKGPWIESFINLFDQIRSTPERLALLPLFQELPVSESFLTQDEDLDSTLRVRLQYAAAELATLQHQFEKGERLCRDLLEALAGKENECARERTGKTEVLLGSILRAREKFTQAIQIFQKSIDKSALSVSERLYALGSMAYCKLMIAHRLGHFDEVELSRLHETRKALRSLDLVRYALLTQAVGKFFRFRKEYSKALTYYGVAARIYEKSAEHSRYIIMQRNIGQIHLLMGHYREALGIFQHVLPKSESLGFINETLHILRFLISSLYMSGEIRKIPALCLHFVSLCQRLGDFSHIAKVIEAASFSYLEVGNAPRALKLVQEYLRNLDNESLQTEIQSQIATGELLLMRIYQYMGQWHQAAQASQMLQARLLFLSGQKFPVQNLKQIHWLYQVEAMRHDHGPRLALAKLEALIENEVFSNYLTHEAYFQALDLAVWAQDDQMVQKYQKLCKNVANKGPAGGQNYGRNVMGLKKKPMTQVLSHG